VGRPNWCGGVDREGGLAGKKPTALEKKRDKSEESTKGGPAEVCTDVTTRARRPTIEDCKGRVFKTAANVAFIPLGVYTRSPAASKTPTKKMPGEQRGTNEPAKRPFHRMTAAIWGIHGWRWLAGGEGSKD